MFFALSLRQLIIIIAIAFVIAYTIDQYYIQQNTGFIVRPLYYITSLLAPRAPEGF